MTPIEDDEILYRRIPVKTGFYQPDRNPPLDGNAFNPVSRDTNGLSLTRARSAIHPDFLTMEQFAAAGPSPDGYYMAEMRAGDLRNAGIEIVSDPVDGNPGHALIPELNYTNRKTSQSLEWKRILAEKLTLAVHGPLPSGAGQT